MKILIVADAPVPHRYMNYRADPLVKYLSDRGHDLCVVCNGVNGSEIEDIEGVRFFRTNKTSEVAGSPIERKMSILGSMVRRIRSLTRYERFDVIRPISFLPAVASIFANGGESKAMLVTNLSDFYSDLCRQFMLPGASVISHVVRSFERKVIRSSDAVIVDSPIQRDYWKGWGLDENRCSVVPHGIPRSYNAESNSYVEQQEGRRCSPDLREADFPIPERLTSATKVVFYVGDISHMDGIDVLIAASPLVKREVHDVLFLIVGDGPPRYIRHLRKLISDAEMTSSFLQIRKIPNNQLPRLISLANVCVAPFRIALTSNSSLPNKILEYLALKKPIVCSNGVGVRQMLGTSVRTIRYVPSESPAELANEITIALDTDALRLSAISELAPITEALNWGRIMQREEEIIEAVVTGTKTDLRVFDYKVI